jgi:protein-tyrosine phosphatase
MAEGLLRSRLAVAGIPAAVGSAGLLPGGVPATSHAVGVMARRGIDIGEHVSRTLDAHLARSTPLIIGMARQHVREAVVTYGAAIERTFTLKEIVRRGEKVGGRGATEPVSAWLARVAAGRVVSDLVGDDPEDDVADPIGRPRREYEVTVAELDELIERFVALLVGPGGNVARPGRRGPARPALRSD